MASLCVISSGDEEDRARLMAMNDLDRETILAERAEARTEMMDKWKAHTLHASAVWART
jgi:hypothetical protein